MEYYSDDKDIDKRIDRILSILDEKNTNCEEVSEDERRVIIEIGRLSAKKDYDADKHYALLSKQVKMRGRKHRRMILGWTAAAAVVLLILLGDVGHRRLQSPSRSTVVAEALMPSDNVRLTFRDGGVVNIAPVPGEEIPIQDMMALGKAEVSEITEYGENLSKYNTIEVPKTKDARFNLDDGSLILANSETEVKFPDKFSRKERRIVLEYGEIFVCATKEPSRPFIVEVNGSEIEVLGTSFNVNAYPDAPLEATLVTGSIRFTKGVESVVLLPGQQANVAGEHVVVKEVDVNILTAWTRGWFIFDDLDLKSIMKYLERWYDIRTEFKSAELEKITFTGAIERKYEKEYIFNLLEKTTDINIYTAEDGKVVIEKKKRENILNNNIIE